MAVISLGSTDVLAASETSRFIGPLLRWLFPDALPDTLELVHAAIRKAGHVAEFAVLALLWRRALNWGAAAWRRGAAVRALCFTVIFAVLDETHQAFESARTASVLDVGWDSLGAILGILGRWAMSNIAAQPQRAQSAQSSSPSSGR
jgi:VanZ family protein